MLLIRACAGCRGYPLQWLFIATFFLSLLHVSHSSSRQEEWLENVSWQVIQGKDAAGHARVRRKAVEDDSYLWADATVPYVFSAGVDPRTRRVVRQAIQHIEDTTCIRFDGPHNREDLQRDHPDRKFVNFIMDKGCSSSVGMGPGSGAQNITMDRYCAYSSMIIHELGHVVGMWHEHSRADRNSHLKVVWKNIMAGQEYRVNFERELHMRLLTPYDFTSIMHYKLNMFASPSRPLGSKTLVPFDDSSADLVSPTKDGLSFYDIYTLNTLYRCAESCDVSRALTCEHGGFLDQNCRCVCPPGTHGRQCQLLSCPETESCGGVVELRDRMEIFSPEYPRYYPANCCCSWLLKSPPGTRLTMQMRDFMLERTCGSDHLQINNRHIGIDASSTYCGDQLQNKTIVSESNTLRLTFVSDGENEYRGFRATVTVESMADCASNPCQNSGTCVEMPATDSYYCECQPSYIGQNCNVPVDSHGWSEWSSWSGCQALCGRQYRTRTCFSNTGEAVGGVDCPGADRVSRACADGHRACQSMFKCDFGEGAGHSCGMIQEHDEAMNWTIHSGTTRSPQTGPSVGHTTATSDDGFMYLEASDGDQAQTATMWLPYTNWTVGIYCLQFYYNLHGANMGLLSVFREFSSLVRPRLIWRHSGDHGDQWLEANLNVLLYNQVKIGIQAERGSGYLSDMAVDDISISPRKCRAPAARLARTYQRSYGCYLGYQFFREGPFSFFEDTCIKVNCFCNLDHSIDCPDALRENLCKSLGRGGARRLPRWVR